ncbi:hypothetical protein HGQ19_004352 [Salmonella enterica]|nr:hypothetical protein [Salmonella enterica]ECI4986128.1 hypothetical protein [Salmonella enterica subsp. salamae]EHJ5092576.1 hypothetical protein [Salmonella enterica subsp. salamae serovar 16:m,t:-]HCM1995682.1 hypothetical protein [Salmonella enterica subsp. salamae serovar 53:z4,z24:-]ECJ2292367.1 hypothetical protein [Salmonella enterica subsp. salamae]
MIIKRIFINILFIVLCSNQVSADESIFIERYGFGFERDVDGMPVRHPAINFDECKKKGCDDNISNSENIKVKLMVRQEGETVSAHVNFINYSGDEYFLPKYYYPITIVNGAGEKRHAMCSEKFIISSEDTALDYLSGTCPFDLSINIDRWVSIKPKSEISLKIKLNDIYAFIPEASYYFMKVSGYKLVNKKWFISKSINDSFISILELKVNCDNEHFGNVVEHLSVCECHVFDKITHDLIMGMIEQWGNDDERNSIIVGSEQVVVRIDGRQVKLPY